MNPTTVRPSAEAVSVIDTRSAAVSAIAVEHTFDNGYRALERTDLFVDKGTFCTLLGPSGSGKTTLLRIFAGLLTPTSGAVEIGGVDVTTVPVQKRDIGFVFQHYALFPHMTVAQNVAYPLRIRGIGRDEREKKVKATLQLVDLERFADSRPHQLSGGQQQRVAIGRALVYGPRVLLLDEPLGALDRKLRQQLGSDLRQIQKDSGTTAIYVTHDQEEAFLLSDSVVVMNHGQIRQKGDPATVYRSPRDLFVAAFLGDTNVFSGLVTRADSQTVTISVDEAFMSCSSSQELEIGQTASVSVRPEDISILPQNGGDHDGLEVIGAGVIADRIFMGSRQRLLVTTANNRLLHVEASPGSYAPAPGSPVRFGWNRSSAVLVENS